MGQKENYLLWKLIDVFLLILKELELDNGDEKKEIYLGVPYKGVVIRNKIWHNMKKFSEGTIILVIASDYYNEEDYIRDYKEFRKYINIDWVMVG